MWWIAVLLFLFLVLDVIVKSTGAPAKPPSSQAPIIEAVANNTIGSYPCCDAAIGHRAATKRRSAFPRETTPGLSSIPGGRVAQRAVH